VKFECMLAGRASSFGRNAHSFESGHQFLILCKYMLFKLTLLIGMPLSMTDHLGFDHAQSDMVFLSFYLLLILSFSPCIMKIELWRTNGQVMLHLSLSLSCARLPQVLNWNIFVPVCYSGVQDL
jgi:hypothetical protein